MVGKNCRCPRCGERRKEINPNEDVPLSQKNISMNFFDGMNMEQKKEMLMKRSHEHFKKHIRERKEGLLNQAIGEMSKFRKG